MNLRQLLFQYLFYTGSHVTKESYQPFIQKLEQSTSVSSVGFRTFLNNPLITEKTQNDTILVGHSLGGYFALNDAKRYPHKVAAVVLINSHFNDRMVMPYFKVKMDTVSQPVLTLLAENDERLPLSKGLDDLWSSLQYRCSKKYFVVNRNMTHFSGLTDGNVADIEKLVEPIVSFVNCTRYLDFREMWYLTEQLAGRFRTDVSKLSTNTVLTSDSTNILDAILSLTMPRWLWRFSHFLWFLTTKPNEDMNFMFEDDDHVLWKGSPGDYSRWNYLLQSWVGNGDCETTTIDLPSWHPAILVWLFAPLFPFRKNSTSVNIPWMKLPVNANTTYYKVPHPRRVFSVLDNNQLLFNRTFFNGDGRT